MAKYLVTGIAGFIGSSIAHELVSRGESVRGLDDFSTGKPENIQDIKNDLDFRQASLLDEPARIEVALNRVVSVWVSSGHFRYDPYEHVLFTDLTRDELWDMPGATVESDVYRD